MQPRAKRKEKTGIVISDKMNKTITVGVERTAKHPIYKRIIKQRSKFMVHDEGEIAKMGDRVRIQETRPLSKNKRWRLVEVLKERRGDL